MRSGRGTQRWRSAPAHHRVAVRRPTRSSSTVPARRRGDEDRRRPAQECVTNVSQDPPGRRGFLNTRLDALECLRWSDRPDGCARARKTRPRELGDRRSRVRVPPARLERPGQVESPSAATPAPAIHAASIPASVATCFGGLFPAGTNIVTSPGAVSSSSRSSAVPIRRASATADATLASARHDETERDQSQPAPPDDRPGDQQHWLIKPTVLGPGEGRDPRGRGGRTAGWLSERLPRHRGCSRERPVAPNGR